MNTEPRPEIIGAIIAGGKGRRLGQTHSGDKSQLVVGDKTLLAHIVATLKPQVSRLLLNSNRDPARFADLGLEIVADIYPGARGPMAGIISALAWTHTRYPTAQWLLTVPGDCPFIPRNLAQMLVRNAEQSQADVAYACSAGQDHYIIAAWATDVLEDLRLRFESGTAAISTMLANFRATRVTFPVDEIDPFVNINTPEDLRQVREWLARPRSAEP